MIDQQVDIVTIPIEDAGIKLRINDLKEGRRDDRLLRTAQRLAERWGKRHGMVVGGIRIAARNEFLENQRYLLIRWRAATPPEGLTRTGDLAAALDCAVPNGTSVKWLRSLPWHGTGGQSCA